MPRWVPATQLAWTIAAGDRLPFLNEIPMPARAAMDALVVETRPEGRDDREWSGPGHGHDRPCGQRPHGPTGGLLEQRAVEHQRLHRAPFATDRRPIVQPQRSNQATGGMGIHDQPVVTVRGDQRESGVQFRVVIGDIGHPVRRLVRAQRTTVLPQVDGVEVLAAGGVEFRQFGVEEVVGEAVHVQHGPRGRAGGAVTDHGCLDRALVILGEIHGQRLVSLAQDVRHRVAEQGDGHAVRIASGLGDGRTPSRRVAPVADRTGGNSYTAARPPSGPARKESRHRHPRRPDLPPPHHREEETTRVTQEGVGSDVRPDLLPDPRADPGRHRIPSPPGRDEPTFGTDRVQVPKGPSRSMPAGSRNQPIGWTADPIVRWHWPSRSADGSPRREAGGSRIAGARWPLWPWVT